MLDELTYISATGEVATFGSGAYANESDLRDIEWSYSASGKRWKLRRSRSQRTVPLRLCVPDAGGYEERDRIVSLMERDCMAQTPGRFVTANGYELECFVVGHSFTKYLLRPGYLRDDATVQPTDGAWVRGESHSYAPKLDDPNQGEFLDLPYDLPYDLSSPPKAMGITVEATGEDAPFLLRIFGPAVNPYIKVAGNAYGAKATLAEGDRLEIDGRAKTVTLITAAGDSIDAFDQRTRGSKGSGSYVFERVPRGVSSLEWDGSFGFDLITYDERSTPPWS